MDAAPAPRPPRAPASRPAEPARRLLRLRALFLAALLIGVAALLAPAPRPAEAQSPIWSATLTVEGTTVLGCGSAQACATALTDNTFVYGGVEYTVETVTLIGDSLIMSFDIALPTSLTYVRLQVGSVQLGAGAFSSSNITWAGTALSWTAGQQVRLRLLPPAPDDWRSWNPTVTVADVGAGSFGCVTTPPCSTALTDDGFVHGGVPYKVAQITLTSGGTLTVTFDKNLPSSLNNASAQVGSAQLSGAVRASKSLRWSNTGLSWSAGDRVRLRLIGAPPAAPTGLSLAPGTRADTIAAVWTAPDDTLTALVTGYEVRYKELHARNAAATVAGDPTTGWVTTQVGTTPRATLDAPWNVDRRYHGTVRALSASGASPWSGQAQGAPKDPPAGPAATPLRLLSASRTSVTEGGTVTITARLAGAAAAAVNIPLGVEGTAGAGDYSLSSPGIAIAQGQRSGSVTLTITDDTTVEGAEILYITPDIGPVRNDAVPGSSAVAYQVTALRINIAASDQPTTTTTSSESDSPPPFHSDPYLAELQRRIVACAQSSAMKTAIDNYVKGTGTDADIAAARASTPACQY